MHNAFKRNRAETIQAVILGTFVLAGCNVLRIYEPVRIQTGDWTMYGGGTHRTHTASSEIVPPLKVVWEYDAGAGFGDFSVSVADSLVFVGNLQGELHVIRIGTGKRVGSVDLGSAIVGTPVVSENTVYVPLTRNEENLVAFDLLRGARGWRARIGDVESSPLIAGNNLYVTTMQGELICLKRSDGTVEWKYQVPSRGRMKSIRSSPAFDGGVVYFGADDGSLYAIDADNGTMRWSVSTGKSIIATPALFEGRVFFGSTDTYVYCVDARSGSLIWKERAGSSVLSGAAVAAGRVFVITADGSALCFDAASGSERWKFQTQSVISGAPLVSGTIVYVGSLDKNLYAIDATTGEELWRKSFASRIRTTAVAWRDYLLVVLEDRTIVAMKHDG
jgi:outer membrane protein assembly factor BamB